MAHLTHWKRHLKTSLLGNAIVSRALSTPVIEAACGALGYAWRESFWNPTTTVLTFLLQVLSAEKTLRAAVGDLLTQLVGLGREDLPSADPTAYCQARQRLPGEVPVGLLGSIVEQMKALPGSTRTWLGRRVWIGDGTTVSMPDEPELQEAFPQPHDRGRHHAAGPDGNPGG